MDVRGSDAYRTSASIETVFAPLKAAEKYPGLKRSESGSSPRSASLAR